MKCFFKINTLKKTTIIFKIMILVLLLQSNGLAKIIQNHPFIEKDNTSDIHPYEIFSLEEEISRKQHDPLFLEDLENNIYLIQSVLYTLFEFYVYKDKITNDYLLNNLLTTLIDTTLGKIYQENEENYQVIINNNILSIEKKASTEELVKTILSIILLVDKIENNKNNEGAFTILNSILQSLDFHSLILKEDEFKALKEGTQGIFGGIGIVVGIRNQLLTVIKPLPNSPASQYGIQENDKIITINNQSTYGKTLEELVKIMRGAPQTTVNLSLLRHKEAKRIHLKVKRDIIHVDSVTSKDLTINNTPFLFIKIDNFSTTTANEVQHALHQFKSNHQNKMTGLILDLRSNPGGLLEQAIKVTDLFITEGIIVKTRGHFQETTYANPTTGKTNYPIVVLINNESASASEIVTGALKDNNRAVIIGQNSFGKASVQTVFELPNNMALKLTIANYYTPSDYSIQGMGIAPDIHLQTLIKNDINENLLGFNRYPKKSFYTNKRNNLTQHQPIKTGYYLRNLYQETTKDDQDYETKIALMLLEELRQNWPKHSTKEHNNYMTSNFDFLNSTLNKETKKVTNFLKEKHNVDWSLTKNNEPELILSSVFTEQSQIESGNKLKIFYTIENKSNKDISRASLFFRHRKLNFVTTEILIGKIKAQHKFHSSTELYISDIFQKGILIIDAGLATRGVETKNKPKPIKIEIKERASASLQTNAYLVSEEGGRFHGKLEAKEYAKIRIDIKNNSYVIAKNVDVMLLNLSGSQIEISKDKKNIGLIVPGGNHSVLIDIKASEKILTNTLSLGVFVNTAHLQKPVQESINISSIPTITN